MNNKKDKQRKNQRPLRLFLILILVLFGIILVQAENKKTIKELSKELKETKSHEEREQKIKEFTEKIPETEV